jgi:hypothetical protein
MLHAVKNKSSVVMSFSSRRNTGSWFGFWKAPAQKHCILLLAVGTPLLPSRRVQLQIHVTKVSIIFHTNNRRGCLGTIGNSSKQENPNRANITD